MKKDMLCSITKHKCTCEFLSFAIKTDFRGTSKIKEFRWKKSVKQAHNVEFFIIFPRKSIVLLFKKYNFLLLKELYLRIVCIYYWKWLQKYVRKWRFRFDFLNYKSQLGSVYIPNWLHQWPIDSSALKTGWREVPNSIPGLTCRPSRSKFSVVFSETHVNTD